MNCSEFHEIVSDLARGETAAGGLEHAASCAGCGALLADQRSLSDGLRALAIGTRGEAPERLEGVLRDALRNRPRKNVAVRRGTWRWIAAAAATAALLILAAPRWKREPRRLEPAQAVIHRATEEKAPLPVEQMAQRIAPKPIPVARRNARPRREIRSLDFEALRYDTELTPMEGGQVVRVRLALDQQSGASVQADVLVGDDGMARAIRFVQ